MSKFLTIKGAREHNLKNINLKIPKNKLIVFTGVSGSGKSTMAFDTIYKEGRRRYVESLSTYIRQFLGQTERPKVDSIEGLCPAISIDQKTTSKNPRSTVGTITEIYDYLRLLFAKISKPYCPICGKIINPQTIDDITLEIEKLPDKTRFLILSPIVDQKKGEYVKKLEEYKKRGINRALIDGIIYDLNEKITLDKNKKHTIDLVIDRLVSPVNSSRISDSLESALKFVSSRIDILLVKNEQRKIFSLEYACVTCGINVKVPEPRTFSFNTKHGACEKCEGLGNILNVDKNLVIKNELKSLREGITTHTWHFSDSKISEEFVKNLSKYYNFNHKTPIKNINSKILDDIFEKDIKINFKKENKTITFKGIIKEILEKYASEVSPAKKYALENLMSYKKCDSCNSSRLNNESLCFKIKQKNIFELSSLPIPEIYKFIKEIKLSVKEKEISNAVIIEILSRLKFLINVGLSYLTLTRYSTTLSGGEAQRIRLASQIGSNLTGVLYVMDEPSIGLHASDNDKLINTLKNLKNLGNTLIVVEHDEDTILNAEHIVDFGPQAGVLGGNIIYEGSVKNLINCGESLTGQYLNGTKKIPVPKIRKTSKKFLKIIGASENNLKNLDVKIPLEVFVCITGVSGSGKSTLINEIIYKKLLNELNGGRQKPGEYKKIDGIKHLNKIIAIDQSPIGRTPRSNPATYTGVFTEIRNLFAACSDAKIKGYKSSRFSFNVPGGRCEKCRGDGVMKIEMNFMPDVYVECETCKAKRYNKETLLVFYKGKNIYDVLNMTVDEAFNFFNNIPKIKEILEVLKDVGLSYMKIGQSSTTLSGGEAERIKLATELSKKNKERTLYILDEPTTGLHISDIHLLSEILKKLVDKGNTVLVIEHNLDLIKIADYIIDMGPGGGEFGGEIICTGTPEEIAENVESLTGKYLKKYI